MSERTLASEKPLIFEQSRLGYVDLDSVDLPRTNADGLPVIDPTPEQRYLFDTQGWLLVPGLLEAEDVESMRVFCDRLHREPESLPEAQRSPIAGPLERLTDHPFIVGFMNEFLAHPDLSSQDCYGFRMESSSLCVRHAGEGTFGPHNGNGLWRVPGGGGTLLISGSHKAVFTPPVKDLPHSPLWTTYACPAGSLLLFAEGTTHSTSPWTSTQRDRVAIFSRYNHVNSKWHKWQPHPDLLESLPPKRRTLFRPVHVEANLVDPV